MWGVCFVSCDLCVDYVLIMMCAVESMCFQGLFGAVCVVRVSNAWRWSVVRSKSKQVKFAFFLVWGFLRLSPELPLL
jgi:hypothetical protein